MPNPALILFAQYNITFSSYLNNKQSIQIMIDTGKVILYGPN